MMFRSFAPALRYASLTVLLVVAGALSADPPERVARFFGEITAQGASIPSGLEVVAEARGVEWAREAVETNDTIAFYRLDVPGDDPATPVVEGVNEGQVVEFRLSGSPLTPTVVWHDGDYQRLDLEAQLGADLSVQLSDGQGSLTAGELTSYTVTVQGDGTLAAAGVTLTVTMPTEASFVSASDGGSVSAQQISWLVFDLAAGQSVTRTVQLRAASQIAGGVASFNVVATVTSDGVYGLDPDPSNNSATDSNQLEAFPDLIVSLDDGLDDVAPGEDLVYAIGVANSGSRDAVGVQLRQTIPEDVIFLTATGDGGERSSGLVTWPAFDVAAGGSESFTVRVRVPTQPSPQLVSVDSEASATAANGPDLDPSDNSATDSTAVLRQGNLTVLAVDPAGSTTDPQSLAITGTVVVEVSNTGNADLEYPFEILLFEDRDGDALPGGLFDVVLGSLSVDSGLDSGASSVVAVPVAGTVSFRDNLIYAFVDSTDAITEFDETDNIEHSGRSCVVVPVVEDFDPVVELSWPEDDDAIDTPIARESLSTPIVVELDGDGVPDIVFVAANLENPLNPQIKMRAISGRTGDSLWTIDPPVSDGLAFALSGLAAGDLTGDGDIELVVTSPEPPRQGFVGFSNRLSGYDHLGRLLWISEPYVTHPTGDTFTIRDHPALADLDGDGDSEIIVGGNAFDHQGNLLWAGGAGQGYQSARNADEVDSGAISVVADLDLDGSPEVVAGNTAYRADGSIYWQLPLDDGYPAIGNFDADDEPEIVVVARGFVRLHEHDGTFIWGPVALPGVDPEAGGAPTIADFDADGAPEIGVAGSSYYTVFEGDGTVLWQHAIQDESSNQTGSTVFDLDGNGSFEVIYRDEGYLRILNGEDGQVLFEDLLTSFTANEMPVVADVDADGQAEIIVTSDKASEITNLGEERTFGLRVYGDRNGNWLGTRGLWNQQAYSIDNVTQDGKIPTQPARGWLTHNTFRANAQPPGNVFSVVDVSLSKIVVDIEQFPSTTLSVRVGNGGTSALSAGLPIAFYTGDPAAGGELLGVTATSQSLAAGEFEDVSVEAAITGTSAFTVYAVAGDDGERVVLPRDCREDNNQHQLTLDLSDIGLWVELVDGDDAVAPGGEVTYALSVANASPFTRAGISLRNVLPAEATLVSASDGGVFDAPSHSITWPEFNLASGSSITYVLTYRADDPLPAGVTQLSNLASVFDDGTVPDVTPFNNIAVDVNEVRTTFSDVGGPYTGDEGTAIVFDGSASSSLNGIDSWEWDLDGDGQFDDGSGVSVSHTFPDQGSYPVALRVTSAGEVDIDTTLATVDNVAPTADVPEQTAAEGQAFSLDASFIDPGQLDSHSATISWGDGESGPATVLGRQATASHTYVQDGAYVAQLCLSDGDGGSSCSDFTVTVDNLPPVVTASSRPVSLLDWQAEHRTSSPGIWQVSADGTSVDQLENSGHTVFLSPFPAMGLVYDGTIEVQTTSDDDFVGFVLGFRSGDFQNFDAEYLLIDWKQAEQNSYAEGLAISRVFGRPNALELGSHSNDEANGLENGVEELQRGFNLGSTGWVDRRAYTFTIETSPTRVQVWVDGVLELDVTGDFAFGSGRIGFFNNSQERVRYSSFTVQQINVLEGEEALLEVDFADPGVLDVHTATVDWQDGTVTPAIVDEADGEGSAEARHTYADELLTVAEACVEDDAGDAGCRSVPVTVLNAEPVIQIRRQAGFLGQETEFDVDFTDLGISDTHTAVFHWGDGTSSPGGVVESGGSGRATASHTYSEEVAEARVCVADNDGAETCSAFGIDWLAPVHDGLIEVVASRQGVSPGQSLSYTVRARNLGSLQPTGLVVELALPPELTFVSADRGGTLTGQTVRWTAPQLDYLGAETFTVEAMAASSLPVGVGVATATLSDDGSVGPDADASNNTAENRVAYRQPGEPELEIGINLARDPQIDLTSSGSNPIVPVTNAIDGKPESMWFPDNGCIEGTFLEIDLPREATVFGVGFLAGDGVNARAFTEGRFFLYDSNDELRWQSDVVITGAGEQAIVDLDNQLGVQRIRLEAASIAGCGTLAEVQVFGSYDASHRLRWPEGSTVGLGAFFQASGGSSWSTSVDWGDGEQDVAPALPGASGRFLSLFDHFYPDNGLFPIEACVTEMGGAQGCLSTDADIFNVAPRVSKGEAVDLRLWQTEHGDGSQGDSLWVVSDDGTEVHQQINSRPSVFYGDFPALYTRLQGRITASVGGDGDYVGFVLGVQPEDLANPGAEFLLISWMHEDSPSHAFEGLALSRVFGVPDRWEWWNLRDLSTNGNDRGVEILTRGNQYGDVGWVDDVTYEFTFELTPNRLRVYVDGVLEIDYQGLDELSTRPLDDGRFAFYNYSQHDVLYQAIERQAFVVDEGYELPFRSSFTDPGADTWVVDLDWGDGTTGVGTVVGGVSNTVFTGTHTYRDNLPDEASYPVVACVTDDDGGHDCSTFEVLVRNLPPVVDIGSGDGTVIPAGTPFALNGAGFTDRGVDDTHTAEINWGDGTVEQLTFEAVGPGSWTLIAEHVPLAIGPLTIELCVTDKDSARSCDSLTVEVSNDNGSPPLGIEPGTGGFEGSVVDLVGSFVDLDPADTHTATVDWGDGTIVEPLVVTQAGDGGTYSAWHVYVEDGDYPVTVCVTDSSALEGCGTGTSAVSNQTPVLPSPVDFRTWTTEVFDLHVSLDLPIWQVSADGSSVLQTPNARPSVWLGEFQAHGKSVRGSFQANDDNDYLGFAVGFEPGDARSADADYLLVSWKGDVQDTSPVGLRLWRIRGIPTTFSRLQEAPQAELLASAQTLGEDGWQLGRKHDFRLESTADQFRLWIDGELQLEATAPAGEPFPDGRLGWWLHGQEDTRALDWTVAPLSAVSQGSATLPFQSVHSLNGWTEEAPATSLGGDAPVWQVSADGLSVSQGINSRPSIFYGTEDLEDDQWASVVVNFLDDDVGGLVVGFDPGEGAAPSDYLLVRWRNNSGLSLRRIRGELYSGTELLGTGTNFGEGNHEPNRDYVFTVRLTPERFRLWIDGELELDEVAPADDPFDMGRLGFFCQAQEGITFRQVQTRGKVFTEGDVLPALEVPYGDAGWLDTHLLTAEWADGSAPETVAGSGEVAIFVDHTFADDLTGDASVCVTDDEGAEACVPMPIWVRNAAPIVEAVDQAGSAGQPMPLTSVSYSDAGIGDTHTATVEWGDGTFSTAIAEAGAVTAENTYSVPGTYSATVCVTDDDGAESCKGFEVVIIESGEPEVTFSKIDALSSDVDGDGVADEGDRVLYTLTTTNIGSAAATSMQLTDAIPAHSALVNGTVLASAGTVISEDPVIVDLAALADGENLTVSFEVEIGSLPLEVTELSNQAWLTSTELDAVPSDDPELPGTADPTLTSVIGDDSLRCVSETFEESFTDLWQSALLGDADEGTVQVVGGALHLSGDGSSLYHDEDNGHFFYREAEGDFRFEGSVTGLPDDQGGGYRKACLMARNGLDPLAERFMACFVPHFSTADIPALQFDVRTTAGGVATEYASTQQNVPHPVRFALARRGDAVTVSYSVDDGNTWADPLGALSGTVEVPLPETLQVGLMVASYDTEQTFTAEFDDLSLCYPGPGEVQDPVDPPVCDPQQPVDAVYFVDLSESMTADFADGSGNKLAAARQALLDIHGQIAQRADGSRVALMTFAGARDAQANLDGSWNVLSPLTTDFVTVGDQIAGLDESDIQSLSTTPTALGLKGLREQLGPLLSGDHQPAVIFVTDGVPNIDSLGRGPLTYTLSEIQGLSLRDAQGDFLTWSQAAWLGRFNGSIGTYDGEPLANAMLELERLGAEVPELLIYGLAIHGNGIALGTYSDDLIDYAAWISGGQSYSASDSSGLSEAASDLVDDLLCTAPPPGEAQQSQAGWRGRSVDEPAAPSTPWSPGADLVCAP